MPTHRFRPGDTPPKVGRYELVDHFGERMNVEVWCREGERLPLMAVPGSNSVWFVAAVEAVSVVRAA